MSKHTMLHDVMGEYEQSKQSRFDELYQESLHLLERAFFNGANNAEREVYEIHEDLFEQLDGFLREYDFFVSDD